MVSHGDKRAMGASSYSGKGLNEDTVAGVNNDIKNLFKNTNSNIFCRGVLRIGLENHFGKIYQKPIRDELDVDRGKVYAEIWPKLRSFN